MKKKVCIIHKTKTLDPRSFYKEARTLLTAGYDVCIIGLYGRSETVNGIRLIGFKLPDKRLIRFFITNYRIFIKSCKEKADVYHFHDLDFLPWAVLLKVLTSSKIIYDIHEAHPEYMLLKTYLPKVTRIFFYIFIYLLEHIAIRFFAAIIPNDNYIAKGFKHKRNVVIFNFPTIDFFRNNHNVPWQKRKYDLFYPGSLPKYHFETMMNIAENLNSEKIENTWGIVTNNDSIIVWAKEEAKKRKLDKNFAFLPYTDYLNVYEYLSMSKIGIIPLPPYKKFMKNIPLKMFEFMGVGLPIVLSDLPPSRQFIKGKNCGISVEPNNIDEYVNAIKLLLNNPEKSIEMGKNGKKLVYSQYNWFEEEKKLLNLYSHLI